MTQKRRSKQAQAAALSGSIDDSGAVVVKFKVAQVVGHAEKV